MATGAMKEIEATPSVKDLASSEPSLRRKNVDEIISHLENRSPLNHLSHTQALQLWRGFHVALYMHDSKNQLSVQKLIVTLASTFQIIRSKDIALSHSKSPLESESKSESNGAKDEEEDEFTGFNDDSDENNSSPQTTTSESRETSWLSIYSTAFWETMAREWSGIDQWRMNKYLLLIRLVLREIFTICLSSYFKIDDSSTSPSADDLDTNTSSPTTNSKKRKTSPTPESPAKKSKKPQSSPPQVPMRSRQIPTSGRGAWHAQLSIVATYPLSPRSRSTSDGLRLHMLDIYTEELMTALTGILPHLSVAQKTGEVCKQAEEEFMRPVREIAKDGLARHVRVRAKEVLGEFGRRWKQVVEGDV